MSLSTARHYLQHAPTKQFSYLAAAAIWICEQTIYCNVIKSITWIRNHTVLLLSHLFKIICITWEANIIVFNGDQFWLWPSYEYTDTSIPS
jgi:hypothetical protein